MRRWRRYGKPDSALASSIFNSIFRLTDQKFESYACTRSRGPDQDRGRKTRWVLDRTHQQQSTRIGPQTDLDEKGTDRNVRSDQSQLHSSQTVSWFCRFSYLCRMKTERTLSGIEGTAYLRCPRCRKGRLFKNPSLFSFTYEMHRRCPVCDVDFEPEPGFYYGAMFISYITTGFVVLSLALTMVFLFKWSLTPTMTLMVLLVVLTHAYVFKISRAIWLRFFVKYQG